ncbi:MAG: calcium/sodium antiporter [Planctomycetes bacterium]|nr:calcium/sodium antiporter [Planctomycetota bacterium]
MNTISLLYVAGGLAVLVAGAEVLVRGASRLALALGITPLVVGLTVVAFGTSAPELAISVKSVWSGQADIALGNVVGSNIFNVLFILGVAALVAPLAVDRQLIRIEVPLMIGCSVLAYVLCLDRSVSRLDGVLLAVGIVAYTAWVVRESRKKTAAAKNGAATAPEAPAAPDAAAAAPKRSLPWLVVLILLGLGMLVAGSNLFLAGAIEMAQALGVSELVIGLTLVAGGTSLPEVATSVMASFKGEREIAVGNVVGSNIFNILCVLGVSAAASSDGIPVAKGALDFDLPVMIAVAVACLPIFVTGGTIERWEGVVFFAYYIAYVAWLVLHAQEHPLLEDFRVTILGFVAPLTALTLGVLLIRHLRRRPAGGA